MLLSVMVMALISTVNPDATMAYSTDTHLTDRISQDMVIQLTNDDGGDAVDQDILDRNRSACTEIVDGYLRGRYTVPATSGTELLAGIEADLLVDKLYSRRGNIEKPDTVTENRKQAYALLQSIAKGDIQLEDQPDAHAGGFVSNKSSADREFPNKTLNRF